MSQRILSLGQCAADNYALAHFIESSLGAEVTAADTALEAQAQLKEAPFDLVLVNRILDANGASGLEFISQLKGEPALAGIPVMLVSNHLDAQKQAVALGAVPGFGKASLAAPRTLECLTDALGEMD